MTAPAYAWGPVQGRPERVDRWGVMAFAMAVIILLLYSQGWILPLVGRKFDADSSALVRNMFLPGYAMAIVLVAMTPGEVIGAILRQPFLLLILGVAAASALWSTAPDQTMRRIIALYGTTLGAIVLAARYRWSTLAEIFAVTYAILIAGCYITAILFPSIGRMQDLFPGAWRGLWMEKNALGNNIAMGFPLLCAAGMMVPKRRWLWWGVAALGLGLVLLSTSKTSLISAMLGVLAIAFVAVVRRGPVSSVAATWAAILAVVLLACFVIFASDVFLGLLGKDATLTGRTKIWSAVIRQAELRPWTGYGYAAVWDDTSPRGPLAWITKEAGFRARHAHNSWLEQWLGMGWVGLAAFALFFTQTMIGAMVSVFRTKGAYLAFPFLIIYALTSLTESIAVTYNDLRWMVFVLLAVKLFWRGKDVD